MTQASDDPAGWAQVAGFCRVCVVCTLSGQMVLGGRVGVVSWGTIIPPERKHVEEAKKDSGI